MYMRVSQVLWCYWGLLWPQTQLLLVHIGVDLLKANSLFILQGKLHFAFDLSPELSECDISLFQRIPNHGQESKKKKMLKHDWIMAGVLLQIVDKDRVPVFTCSDNRAVKAYIK